jgi:hypothetical protein
MLMEEGTIDNRWEGDKDMRTPGDGLIDCVKLESYQTKVRMVSRQCVIVKDKVSWVTGIRC